MSNNRRFLTKRNSFFHKFLGSTLLLILIASCAARKQYLQYETPPPSLASINIIDRNGMSEIINNTERLQQYSNVDFLTPQPFQKVLRIYNRDLQGNMSSYITSYYSNGYPRQYLEVVNSRAFGTYQEWHPNGVQKIEAKVIGGTADIIEGAERTWLFDGCCQVWDENANLQASIPYAAGLLEGVSTYFHSNGSVWKQIPYHKNQIDGVMEVYQDNGILLERCCYQSGLKEGESLRYWNESQIAAQENYSEGLLAYAKYYNFTGECIAQINQGKGYRAIFSKDALLELHEYHNGVLDGEVQVFDKYGRMIKLTHMKNGYKQGEEIFYYDAPRFQKILAPKISINWYDGKIQGTVKTWYENGQQESQKELSNNRKNGHSTVWYDDGSLMMIEEYRQDKLVKGEYYAQGERVSVSEVLDGKGTATIFGPNGTFQRKIVYINGKPLIED